jgi:hypothetical protein
MNTEPSLPPSSQPSPTPPAFPQSTRLAPAPAHNWKLEPIEGTINFASVIENLLRAPGRILHEAGSGASRVPLLLLVISVFCLGVFGFLLGTFSGGIQYWAAPAKIVLGVLAATLICLPSLYIFSALGGIEARLAHIVALAVAAIALTALLLLGFAPVLWVFSQSTESLSFMGTLALAFWMISLIFGMRMLHAAATALRARSPGYLTIWIMIFVVVTLQMSTAMRPIIGTAETFLPQEKKFFITHWIDELDTSAKKARTSD